MAGTVVLHPVGELDLATTAPPDAQWQRILNDQAPDLVVVDLGQVIFMDVAGARPLLVLVRRQRQRGGQVSIRNAQPLILTVL